MLVKAQTGCIEDMSKTQQISLRHVDDQSIVVNQSDVKMVELSLTQRINVRQDVLDKSQTYCMMRFEPKQLTAESDNSSRKGRLSE